VAEINLPSKSPFSDEKQPGIVQSKMPESALKSPLWMGNGLEYCGFMMCGKCRVMNGLSLKIMAKGFMTA
jgi:hypothetical protein